MFLPQHVDAGRIDGQQIAHADDAHLRGFFADDAHGFQKLVRRPEKKEAVYLIDFDPVGDAVFVDCLRAVVFFRAVGLGEVLGHDIDVRNHGDAADKQKNRQDHPHLDGRGQINQHRQAERGQKHDDIADGTAQNHGE